MMTDKQMQQEVQDIRGGIEAILMGLKSWPLTPTDLDDSISELKDLTEALDCVREELAEAYDLRDRATRGRTIYHALKDAGCELDHRHSDLFVRWTKVAQDVAFKQDARPRTIFCSEGKKWAEFPFAYTPFWEKLAVK